MNHVSVYSDWKDIPQEVVRHCRYPAQPDFLLSQQWLQCLDQHASDTNMELRVYVVSRSDQSPVVVLFCRAMTDRAELSSLTNFYSICFGPMEFGSPDELADAYDALCRYIAQERPAWRRIELRYLPQEVNESHPLVTSFSRHGFASERYHQYHNWYLAKSDCDFDAYFSRLPSRARNTIRRKTKAANRKHDVRVLILSEDNAELRGAIDDYVRIYNQSWKKPEPYPEFIPSLARECAGAGTLRLGLLYIDDEPAAGQFWIVSARKAVIYKLAYDEKFAKLSPGSILSTAMFEDVYALEHIEEIDYGVGNEGYKRDWMDAVRDLYGLEFYNLNTLSGRMRNLRRRLVALAKKFRPASED